jgi:DNA-binding NtrC family response regulator
MDLLRVLQERRFYRVGGSEEIEVDVRVIAASNLDLEQAVKSGKFRDDLFYRLNVINIRIPALRDRREDIPLLIHHFIERIAQELNKEVNDIAEGGMKILLNHNWPGNVRELENTIERAMITAKAKILTDEDFGFLNQGHDETEWKIPADLSLEEVENKVISATLQRTHGNIKEAASILDIDRSTLYDRIKKFGLARR